MVNNKPSILTVWHTAMTMVFSELFFYHYICLFHISFGYICHPFQYPTSSLNPRSFSHSIVKRVLFIALPIIVLLRRLLTLDIEGESLIVITLISVLSIVITLSVVRPSFLKTVFNVWIGENVLCYPTLRLLLSKCT